MPLLEELLTERDALPRRVWLDLGPAQSGLISRLQPRGACVLVADLPSARAEQLQDWHRPERLLPDRHWKRPLDRVLAWSLFDYLDATQLVQLSEQIVRRAAPGCRIHALIHYAAHEMPQDPPLWRFLPTGGFDFGLASAATRAAPRYSPKALEKAMPELRVERTVLLNNGMQEFVLEIRR